MASERWSDQMYDHELVVVRGPAPQHRLEYFAPKASGVTFERGSVISAQNDGSIVAGCPAGETGNRPMPMFAIQGTEDLDVYTDMYNTSVGVQSAIVATGGFEIATTAFDKDATYNVNDLLTCNATGKVVKAAGDAYGTEVILGVCSVARSKDAAMNAISVPTTNSYGVPLLTFWATYLPAGTTAEAGE